MESNKKSFRGYCAVCGCEAEGREPFGEEAERLMGILGNLQACKECGYVNIRLGIRPPLGVNREWLGSDAYVNCDGIDFDTEDLKRKYRYCMIRRMSGEPTEEVNALLDFREGLKMLGMSEKTSLTERITGSLINTYEKILASNPEDCEALFNCCEEMIGLRRYKDVIELTKQMQFPDTKEGKSAKELALKECSIATKYHEITTDFNCAYSFLNRHPAFCNSFQDNLVIAAECKDGQDQNAFSREYRISLECGPYDEEGPTWDPDLDTEGDTFEEAIVQLAKNVLRKYGMNGAAFSSSDGHKPEGRRSNSIEKEYLEKDEFLKRK